jgi:hypothetical protein
MIIFAYFNILIILIILMQATQYSHKRAGLILLCSDNSLMPEHVAVLYLFLNVFY